MAAAERVLCRTKHPLITTARPAYRSGPQLLRLVGEGVWDPGISGWRRAPGQAGPSCGRRYRQAGMTILGGRLSAPAQRHPRGLLQEARKGNLGWTLLVTFDPRTTDVTFQKARRAQQAVCGLCDPRQHLRPQHRVVCPQHAHSRSSAHSAETDPERDGHRLGREEREAGAGGG